jgi:hypothetical protein
MLFMAVLVFLNKGIRAADNLGTASEIAFHQKHLSAWMHLFKADQSLRKGCPIAIDTLIFIPDLKEIPTSGKEVQDLMLDL